MRDPCCTHVLSPHQEGFGRQVLGAPVSAGLLLLDGRGGLRGWQFLFLVLGLVTIAYALVVAVRDTCPLLANLPIAATPHAQLPQMSAWHEVVRPSPPHVPALTHVTEQLSGAHGSIFDKQSVRAPWTFSLTLR